MNRIFFFTIILFCLCATDKSYAQFSIGFDSLLQQKFDFQVKQISQFFDRFNFKEQLRFGNDFAISRAKNLVSLVNLKDTSLTHDAGTVDFLKFVSNENNHVYLDYTDSNWFAIAHCSFIYQNQKINIDLILKTEGTLTNGYSWVIIGAKGNIFSFPANEKKSIAFINPMNHEIGFTDLSKAINEKNKISSYASATFYPEKLSAFFIMVQNGDLKLKQINSIDYEFLEVPDWIFIVKDFNRADYNSGWLIASLIKVGEKQKYKYKINELKN